MVTECIITGVILIVDNGDVGYNGDLFQQDDTYIVNCNERSAYTPVEHWREQQNVKWIMAPPDAWTRRGVWVFPVVGSTMSKAAWEYIK